MRPPWQSQKLIAFVGGKACTWWGHRGTGASLLSGCSFSSPNNPSSPLLRSQHTLVHPDIRTRTRSAGCLFMNSSRGGGRSGRGGRRGGRGGSNRWRSDRNNNRRGGRNGTRGSAPVAPPPPGQPGRECHGSCVAKGLDVYVVKKADQRTGKETRGEVSRLLTKSAYHPRGIKVMLVGGDVGRVTRFADDDELIGRDNGNRTNKKKSLSDYLLGEGVEENLSRVVMAAAEASSKVARDLRQLSLLDDVEEHDGSVNVQGETQNGMDVRSNDIFLAELKPHVRTLASEEEEGLVSGDSINGGLRIEYDIAFDPLDGSSNLDVAAPTGSIFGIYQRDGNSARSNPFELPGRQSMVAAAYTVYSSATELVLAGLGENVVGFTLDAEDDTFRCSRPDITCPERGPYYSLNEAREPDWPDGLRRWINDAKRGQTPSGIKYSSRYACSLTADFHRILLKGGWAGNPRPHLRLLYEAAPLAFIAEAAGGTGSDGVNNLLDVRPTSLHDRVCCFLGSKLDVRDLEQYGNVQQSSKRYDS